MIVWADKTTIIRNKTFLIGTVPHTQRLYKVWWEIEEKTDPIDDLKYNVISGYAVTFTGDNQRPDAFLGSWNKLEDALQECLDHYYAEMPRN